MELISTFLAMLAGIGSAIVGHFVAHDLYHSAPRSARRLLRKAVRALPETERERYSEEWLAHLEECSGVISKFRHAIECRMMAWKLRQIFEQQLPDVTTMQLTLSAQDFILADLKMNIHTALPILLSLTGRPMPSDERFAELANDPRVNRETLVEFYRALGTGLEGDSDVFRYNLQFFDDSGNAVSFDAMKDWARRLREYARAHDGDHI
jgi:hypothetical protein